MGIKYMIGQSLLDEDAVLAGDILRASQLDTSPRGLHSAQELFRSAHLNVREAIESLGHKGKTGSLREDALTARRLFSQGNADSDVGELVSDAHDQLIAIAEWAANTVDTLPQDSAAARRMNELLVLWDKTHFKI